MNMNSSVWVVWAAQGSREKNQFEYFLTMWVCFSTFHRQNNFYKYCSIFTKMFLNIKVRKQATILMI